MAAAGRRRESSGGEGASECGGDGSGGHGHGEAARAAAGEAPRTFGTMSSRSVISMRPAGAPPMVISCGERDRG